MMNDRPKPYKLSGVHFWTLCISLLLLWASGMGWLYLHYFCQVQTQFGLSANPAEHWLLRVHGFFLIPALMALGGILFAHIPRSWSIKAMKRSGVAQILAYLVLIATGYLLYYAGGDRLRNSAGLIHWGLGALAPLFFVWHYLSRKSLANANAKNNTAAPEISPGTAPQDSSSV